MIDLTIASLNLQIIAMGVFFGTLAAWIVRWAGMWIAIGVYRGTRAAYKFLCKKYEDSQRDGVKR